MLDGGAQGLFLCQFGARSLHITGVLVHHHNDGEQDEDDSGLDQGAVLGFHGENARGSSIRDRVLNGTGRARFP